LVLASEMAWYARAMGRSSDISAIEEVSIPRGWMFRCDLAGGGEAEVRLDWADYDHWCPSGGTTPSRVVEIVIRVMFEHGATVPASFDAARVRHVVPEADKLITGLM